MIGLPPSWRATGGQAAVELVALLPLLFAAGLAAAAILASHAAGERAGAAAQAGAMAILQGGDPRTAAREALPRGTHAVIRVRGRGVTVEVRPRLAVPGLGHLLTASATAHAGPGVPAAAPAGSEAP